MRLDVSVNMLTFQALKNGRITVFGGEQTRPNIHIKDMANVCRLFMANREIISGCYNAGFENISIKKIAEKVQRQQMQKLLQQAQMTQDLTTRLRGVLNTGFKPEYGIDSAINEIINAYKSGELIDKSRYGEMDEAPKTINTKFIQAMQVQKTSIQCRIRMVEKKLPEDIRNKI